jgi:hypothetical protein
MCEMKYMTNFMLGSCLHFQARQLFFLLCWLISYLIPLFLLLFWPLWRFIFSQWKNTQCWSQNSCMSLPKRSLRKRSTLHPNLRATDALATKGLFRNDSDWAWWYVHVIIALGRLRWEDHKFKASLDSKWDPVSKSKRMIPHKGFFKI